MKACVESTSHLQPNKPDICRNLMYFGHTIFARCQTHASPVGQQVRSCSTDTRTHTSQKHTHAHTHTYIQTHKCVHKCTHTRARPCTHTHAYRHIHVMNCVAVCYSMLQCVAVCCSVLQCVAVCCNVLQCVAVCCSALRIAWMSGPKIQILKTATHCNTLQHAATHGIPRQRTLLQHTTTHYNT